jgi:cell division protease FtsH
MVTRFGMSSKLGPLTYGRSLASRFLAGPIPVGDERNFSEETARAIDGEIRSVVEGQQGRAREMLERRRGALERLAEALLDRETIERGELEAIVAEPPRGDGSVRAELVGHHAGQHESVERHQQAH